MSKENSETKPFKEEINSLTKELSKRVLKKKSDHLKERRKHYVGQSLARKQNLKQRAFNGLNWLTSDEGGWAFNQGTVKQPVISSNGKLPPPLAWRDKGKGQCSQKLELVGTATTPGLSCGAWRDATIVETFSR